MTHNTYQWSSYDGLQLFAQSWIPNPEKFSEPRAVLNFVHGIGEHSTRYYRWMPFFVEAGFAVFAIEYRGHGQSEGKRGYIKDYEDLLKDIDTLFEQSAKTYPTLPVFLYGHSLGGNIVCNYLLKRKPNLKGLIATSPWLNLFKEPPQWQINLVKFIHRFAPGLRLTSGINSEEICQDQALVKQYKLDPNVHSKISLELFLSAYNNGKWAIDHAHEVSAPIYLAHGAEDKITDPKGSEAFFKNNPEKVTLKIWEGMLHELHNEPIREQHAQMIIDWMNGQLK